MIFWFILVPGSVAGLVSPCSFVSFLRNTATNDFFIAHERRGNMVCCCLGSMLVYFFFPKSISDAWVLV